MTAENMKITHELMRIFREYLSVNHLHMRLTRPHSSELLFDSSSIMQGVYYNRDEDTFSFTPDGLLRRFFEWCLDPEPKTEDQVRAHMLVMNLLLYEVLGESIGDLRSLAQKWYDSHKE